MIENENTHLREQVSIFVRGYMKKIFKKKYIL